MKSPIINRLIFILAVSYWYQPVVMSQVTSGAQGCNYIYWQWNGANQEYPRIVDFYLHANGNLDLGIFQKQTVEDGWGGYRSSTVEPVLGTLINHHNMKRINSRGMKQAHKHVLMAALTYNLKKYLRFVVKKPSVVAQVISLKLGEVYCFLKTHLHELKNSFLSHSNFSILNYN